MDGSGGPVGDLLTNAAREELADLARRYGEPLRVRAEARGGLFFDTVGSPKDFGEVCMVIRRRSGRLLLTPGDHSGPSHLPTCHIFRRGILRALLREVRRMDIGLDLEVRRFLAWVEWDSGSGAEAPSFHTFAFLLDEVPSGPLIRWRIGNWLRIAKYALGGSSDISPPELKGVLAFREIDAAELPGVAASLEALEPNWKPKTSLGERLFDRLFRLPQGYTDPDAPERDHWPAWGRARAVLTRTVHRALLRAERPPLGDIPVAT